MHKVSSAICILVFAGIAAGAAEETAAPVSVPPLPTDPAVILADMCDIAYEKRETAAQAFKSLPESRQAEMIPGLVRLAAAKDREAWFGQFSACTALQHMGTNAASAGPGLEAAVVELIPRSDRTTVLLLINTARAVDRDAEKRLLPRLLPFLQGKDKAAMRLAMHALSACGTAPDIPAVAVDAVAGVCKDAEADGWLRQQAIKTLSSLSGHEQTAVSVLLALMNGEDTKIMRWAVTELGNMGARAESALKELKSIYWPLQAKIKKKTATRREILLAELIRAASHHIQSGARKKKAGARE
jgi:hypothetical protein